MKNLDRYLAEIRKGIPDIEERLCAGADEAQLEQLARKAGCGLPAQLLELYRRFDGEDMAKGTGFLAAALRAARSAVWPSGKREDNAAPGLGDRLCAVCPYGESERIAPA